mmetsp:Transcript_60760/g.94470  ORF Transcript_60760/g.94470 Transcript_60760/m.94470 type:complete len:339 (+) Transcript_60760:1341-2357(+)
MLHLYGFLLSFRLQHIQVGCGLHELFPQRLRFRFAISLCSHTCGHCLHLPLGFFNILLDRRIFSDHCIVFLLLFLIDFVFALHLLPHVVELVLCLFAISSVRFHLAHQILQLGLHTCYLFGGFCVRLLHASKLLRTFLIACLRPLGDLALNCIRAGCHVGKEFFDRHFACRHLFHLLILIFQTVLRPHVLKSNTEFLEALHFVLIRKPELVILSFLLQLFQSRRDVFCEQLVDLVNLALFLFQRLQGSCLLVLVHPSTCCLFDHTQSLLRFHVDDLGDAALHNQKVRIVHVQGDRVEEVLNLVGLDVALIQQIPIPATNDNLPCDSYSVMILVAHWTI